MNVDITVEVGTQEQQLAIKSELKLFLDAIGKELITEINLAGIFVPIDFDTKVNMLQKSTSYKSSRGNHIALAKIIDSNPSEKYIVLSPYLYTDQFNLYLRLHIFSHELYHLINRTRFRIEKYNGTANGRYMANMITLYDEYSANRFSSSLTNSLVEKEIDPQIRDIMKEFFLSTYKGHIMSLQDPCKYYSVFKKEISKFRFHGDITKFLNNISGLFDEVTKTIIYCFAYADALPFIHEEFNRIDSVHFIDENTHNLINKYRNWYLNLSFDFNESLNDIKSFISNFGMVFEDTPQGEYCHVIDI
ncbi:MAG: hypothetical protein Q8P40_04770 [Nitrospirota bacterium]|nr:hypothetical protein [Nitrospirota bacterium]